jgi:hypothetical protein
VWQDMINYMGWRGMFTGVSGPHQVPNHIM